MDVCQVTHAHSALVDFGLESAGPAEGTALTGSPLIAELIATQASVANAAAAAAELEGGVRATEPAAAAAGAGEGATEVVGDDDSAAAVAAADAAENVEATAE